MKTQGAVRRKEKLERMFLQHIYMVFNPTAFHRHPNKGFLGYKEIPSHSDGVCGYLYYNRDLTQAEEKNYDLVFLISQISDNDKLVNKGEGRWSLLGTAT